ncbi:MAG: 2-C-methyl-D-erythritol 2,4-cyclodiphosphate synthase [Fidelibacterota bacterium]
MNKVKTGIGYDVHALKRGRKLIIGGVEIPADFGVIGHSDGDVLIHAIVDALLGATCLSDIGQLFPSDDDQWAGADSRHFLTVVNEKIRKADFEIINIDSVIILQQPTLKDFIPQMRYQIAYNLQIDESAVSIKATTTDRLGFIGSGKGIAAQAICTIVSNR